MAFIALLRRLSKKSNFINFPKFYSGVGDKINETVEPIAEERAQKLLVKVQIIVKVRTKILPHKDIQNRLLLCPRSVDLPIWWKPGLHDHELLLAVDRSVF